MKHLGSNSSIQVSQTTTRSLVWSMAITLATGAFLDALKVPLGTAESFAAVVGFASFAVGQYISLVPEEVQKRLRQLPQLSQIFVPISLISLSAILIFSMSVITPLVQARILNSELQNVAYGPPRFDRAQHVFKNAIYEGVKLNPKLVSDVLHQSSTSTEGSGWPAYLAGVNYVLSQQSFDENAPTYKHSAFDLGQHNSFKELRLTGLTIVYHGGPLALSEVTFRNCTFDVEETENGRKLLQAVLSAKGNPLTLDLQ